MDDSNEVHSEGNKVSQDNKQKRKLKTPAQLTALENFYNEHKYPGDELKAKVAEEIGLTEKQISGWFCHRRLKDKRLSRDETYAYGRQDRSSGVIQDRGSGHRQDSCGSTKQIEYKNIDPREVESRRLYGHDLSATDLNYDHRNMYTGDTGSMDSISSESSSSLQDRFISRKEGSYDMEASRHLTQNGGHMPQNLKNNNKLGYKPSGYLKVKGKIENVAITAVKRQLGSYYQEDGPLLGVEFDPVPPGSFESPSSDPLNEPIHFEDSRLPYSPEASEVLRHPDRGPDSYFESSRHNIMYDPGLNKEIIAMSKRNSPLHNSKPLRGQTSSLDVYEDSVQRMTSDYVSFHDGPYIGNKTGKKSRLQLPEYDKSSSKLIKKNENLSKSSNVLLGCSKTRPYVVGMTKEEEPYGERKLLMEYHDPFGGKVRQNNDFTVAKGVGIEESPHQEYVTKSDYGETSQRENQINGDDESAETGSSLD